MPEADVIIAADDLVQRLRESRRLSVQDKRRAVMLEIERNADWSDRRLAQELGVSRELVAKVRGQLAARGDIARDHGRVGADGKLYKTAGIRPKRKGKAENDLITASARRIMEIVVRSQADDFLVGYRQASLSDRGLLQAAAIKLAAQLGQLRKLA